MLTVLTDLVMRVIKNKKENKNSVEPQPVEQAQN